MKFENLQRILLESRDPTYREFMARLIPNVNRDAILGVRTPQLRQIARELEDGDLFLTQLPHTFFEENQIHAFLLERKKDFEEAIFLVEQFLPYVDNWATCDQLRPKVFQKNREKMILHIERWLSSSKPYTVRFGVEMLMCHFLDEDFCPAYLEKVASIQSEHYYVRMMIAWYFASALTKQYDFTLPYLEQNRLNPWIHNKTIQKAVESGRISPERKNTLKQLRR